MEFTEAESNMNDLISEYQQYQVRILVQYTFRFEMYVLFILNYKFVHFPGSNR